MAYKIVMPQLGLTMEEGSVTSWLKKPGDWVEKGETLFTVETDKVEMEVESVGKGYLGTIQVELGVKVPVGTLLAMLNDEPGNTA
jgi:pyruvate dehydrogenase E2 component (dihydrolipoamide acetyltransferase)